MGHTIGIADPMDAAQQGSARAAARMGTARLQVSAKASGEASAPSTVATAVRRRDGTRGEAWTGSMHGYRTMAARVVRPAWRGRQVAHYVALPAVTSVMPSCPAQGRR